jgi:hypothetical protein
MRRSKPPRDPDLDAEESAGSSVLSNAIQRFLSKIPDSDEAQAQDPLSRSRRIAKSAARRASAISTTLALPPGPLGMMTVVPDLLSIWDVQRKMVADIAAAHGQTAVLSRETMLWCLFKHGTAALLRDVVVRGAERFVIRPASVQALRHVLTRIGVHVSHQALGRTVSRFVPLLGALCVGAYAYRDTEQVAATAIELFSSDVVVDAPA